MNIELYSPNIIYSFLFRPEVKQISIVDKNIRLKCRNEDSFFPVSDFKKISLVNNLVFYTVVLDHVSGRKFEIKGLNKSSAAAAFHTLQKLYFNALLESSWAQFSSVYNSWKSLLGSRFYISNSRYLAWIKEHEQIKTLIPDSGKFLDLIEAEKRRIFVELGDVFRNGPDLIKSRNEEFVSAELIKWNDFFNVVERNPLTDNQRAAVLHDEDNDLVVAGAGTGKTSTIIAKVGYILKNKLAKPEEILLLAFTKKAAEEIKERIDKKFETSLNVRTFHSLGLEILAHSEGRKPSLCKETQDDLLMQQTLGNIIQKLMASLEFRRNYVSFRVFCSAPYKPAWEFETMAEYSKFLKKNNVRALSGARVKSFEECAIANWLYINGINFEYESKYKYDVADKDHRQYMPDFYLVDYDIYLEHFALNKKGKTPKWIPENQYKAEMEWKRRLHKEKGTRLIETYSWQRQEGILLNNLEEICRNLGIVLKPIAAEDIFKRLNELRIIDPILQLIATFQRLFKGNGYSKQDLYKQLKPYDLRANLFLDIFFAVHEIYEKRNLDNGDIDFNDMISRACNYIDSGHYLPEFKYILVDEFQDISLGRAQLLKRLRNNKPDVHLFCVGDDWQSIYRFTGSDVSLMTNFEKVFGFTKIINLDKTFRFNNQIEAVSTRFILKNPSQMKKRLQPNLYVNDMAVILNLKGVREDYIGDILNEIKSASGNASVFVLNRYNFLIPDRQFQRNLAKQFKGLKLSFLTTHSAKGLEADYVIIDNVNSGLYGFPTEIVDDPLLNLVLPEPDKHENGEERRLFYVALTRARKKVFVAADQASYSSFVQELIKDNEYAIQRTNYSGEKQSNCPSCGSGQLLPRSNGAGDLFYSCSNYPLCTYSEDACPNCRKGPFVKINGAFQCSECGLQARSCPKCNGRLVEREGRYGLFLGCTMFFSEWNKCSYTENVNGTYQKLFVR
jgi:DNA helicase-4